ncbi:MAG: cupredoxin domain-containing protein [Candidatus Hodarchaeales archaeon]|jgi:plastocyanin
MGAWNMNWKFKSIFFIVIFGVLSGCLGEETPTTPQPLLTTLPPETAAPHFPEAPRPSTPPPDTPTHSIEEISVKVMVSHSAFNPSSVTIKRGGIVIWENLNTMEHSPVSIDGRFGTCVLKAAGDSCSRTFSESGTYEYYNKGHPSVKGTIIVE